MLPINQNQALFALLGTTYGGNGQTTFALPNLQGCTPIHTGAGHILGEKAGTTTVTLTQAQLPAHTHFPSAKNALGNANLPSSGAVLAQSVAVQQNGSTVAVNMYSNNNTFDKTLNPGAISSVGGSQAHTNMMPYLALNFCIALQGIFPSRN
jgi:microcystin-dependent protein